MAAAKSVNGERDTETERERYSDGETTISN